MDCSGPHIAPSSKRSPRLPAWPALAILLLVGCAADVLAIDGRVDVTASRQSGGAGDSAYRTDSLREDYGAGDRIELSRSWLLNVDMLARREQYEGHALGLRSYTRTTSLTPGLTLNFRRNAWQGTFNGRAQRRDWTGANVVARRDEQLNLSAWLHAGFTSWDLEFRAQENASERRETGFSRESREHIQGVTVRHYFWKRDELRYSLWNSRQELRSQGAEVRYRTHQVQYRGNHDFAAGRGRVSIDAQASHFRQEEFFGLDNPERLLVPIWAGFSLDDTPEYLDPAEDDPIADGRLNDGDRDARTGVNIGESATPVQQYGGDWRNIIFDLGEPAAITSARLYIDTRIAFPGFFAWQVFVSDDPEGRDWGAALSPADYTVAYEDLADGRQGWRLTFTSPLVHRRIKIVDLKSGLTEPDIYITEFEVYGPAEPGSTNKTRTAQGRFFGGLAYDLLRTVTLSYDTDLQERRDLDTDDRLRRQMHAFGLQWRINAWTMTARHQLNRLDSPAGRDTDANSQTVSLAKTDNRDLTWRFAWIRNEDDSYTNRHLTHSWNASMNWTVLPRLEWMQQATYGIRDAEDIDGTAHSWTVATILRGDIRPSLVATLRRTDRWTDREAGSGFSRFNDTESILTWAIAPLVSATSQVTYRVRNDEQWILRHTLGWTPMPGGSVTVRFYASDYQDTSTDYLRRGGGVQVTWRARPRLRLEAGAEQTLVKENADRNTPLNLNARGYWTF